jgi:hypothetical protein
MSDNGVVTDFDKLFAGVRITHLTPRYNRARYADCCGLGLASHDKYNW